MKTTALKPLPESQIRGRPVETSQAQAQAQLMAMTVVRRCSIDDYPQTTECTIALRRESLTANAAIMTGKDDPRNVAYLVDIELLHATRAQRRLCVTQDSGCNPLLKNRPNPQFCT